MKAVGYFQPRPIDHPQALVDLELPAPQPGPQDLLVAVEAVSVNPVDTKVRASRAAEDETRPVVLGWDAVGVVREVGTEARGFAAGDRVWYAGALQRPGSNAQLQCVDARIAAHAPARLSAAQAAALPLTGLTAWELLFDRLGLAADSAGSLLVVGAAGGVGSVLVQLARLRTRLTVIGTASRPQTADWVRALGAHHVIDHRAPFGPQLAALGFAQVDCAASLTHTTEHFPALADAIAPQGRIAAIDDFHAGDIDITRLKTKSASFHWEFMFTRSMYATADQAQQGRILAELARMADAGELRSTLSEDVGPIDAAHLRTAHARIETGRTRGKLVLAGFGA